MIDIIWGNMGPDLGEFGTSSAMRRGTLLLGAAHRRAAHTGAGAWRRGDDATGQEERAHLNQCTFAAG